MLINESWGLWVMGLPHVHCANLVNIEYQGNMRMQVPMVVVSYFKYVRMRLFSYRMRPWNPWSANNISKVIPCYELEKLNYLLNSAARLFKLMPSKPKEVQQFIRKTHSWL